jgi:hypothetical protein
MQDDALRVPLCAAGKRAGASFGVIAAELCFTLQETEVAVHATEAAIRRSDRLIRSLSELIVDPRMSRPMECGVSAPLHGHGLLQGQVTGGTADMDDVAAGI